MPFVFQSSQVRARPKGRGFNVLIWIMPKSCRIWRGRSVGSPYPRTGRSGAASGAALGSGGIWRWGGKGVHSSSERLTIVGADRGRRGEGSSSSRDDERERFERDGDADADERRRRPRGHLRRGRGGGGPDGLDPGLRRVRRRGPGERTESLASGLRLPAAASLPVPADALGGSTG